MRHIIGVAGTAKNTGKTTAFQAVAGCLRARGLRLFMSSIGYDGEDRDTVTGLPKPRISVEDGDIVATALPLMEASPVRWRDVRFTGVRCALGPVYTGTAGSYGRIVLAGPASTKDVEDVLEAAPGDCTGLLDGALSRLAPLSLATHVVFATGAARCEEPARLAREMDGIAAAMSIPLLDGVTGSGSHSRKAPLVGARSSGEETVISLAGGLYVEGADRALVDAVSADEVSRSWVLVDGPVSPGLVESALHRLKESRREVDFVFRHPVDLLLSGDLGAWPSVRAQALTEGHRFFVRRTPGFLGFTLSPYRLRLNSHTGRYEEALLPARPFLDEVRAKTASRLTDIVLEGTRVLDEWLRAAFSEEAV